MKMGSSIDKSRDNHEAVISVLRSSHAAISAVFLSSITAERRIADTDRCLRLRRRSLVHIAGPAIRIHSQAVASKAPHARINRAVPRTLSLPPSISLAERLERSLVAFTDSDRISKYLDCVDCISAAVTSGTAEYEPAVQRLEEAVELLWIKNVSALRELSGQEVGKMNLKSALAEALLRLQDEYRKMIRRLRHADVDEIADGGWKTDIKDRVAGGMDGSEWRPLGSTEERAVLRRLSETLASNDCLEICIDIFVKARRRQAMKTLKRLNPDWVYKYTSKNIGGTDYDPANSLWICQLHFAVTSMLPAEKHLCFAVLSSAMDGTVWSECFAKISHRIMLALFRFGEGFALSANEPHKIINLLKITDTARRLRPALSVLFDDCDPKISARARDLERLLVDSTFTAFSTVALRIDDIQRDFPQPVDASVPSLVLYGVNFLKCVAADWYSPFMAHALSAKTRPNPSKALKKSFINVLDVLQRSVEAIWKKFKDRIAAHVFAMNTNWYIYIKARGSELAIFVGEEEMRRRYKGVAEAAAYAYQEEAWEPMVRMLEKGKVEAFMRGMKGNLRLHHRGYGILDADLRAQIKDAVVKMLARAHEEYLRACSDVVQENGFVLMEDIRAKLGWIFDDGCGEDRRRREEEVLDEILSASTAVALQGRERMKGRRRRRIRRKRNASIQFGNEVQGIGVLFP